MPGTQRVCSNACLSASPESIRRRKALDVEGLGPLTGGYGTGFILMNSGLSTVLIQAECRRFERALSGTREGRKHRVSIANESDQVT